MSREKQIEDTIAFAKDQLKRLESEAAIWRETLRMAELELWSTRQQQAKVDGIKNNERGREPSTNL
jgi:hypothetical protein